MLVRRIQDEIEDRNKVVCSIELLLDSYVCTIAVGVSSSSNIAWVWRARHDLGLLGVTCRLVELLHAIRDTISVELGRRHVWFVSQHSEGETSIV